MAQPEDPEQPGKILQHTRRGLKMVTEEKSLFDLNEPIWHADEKVTVWLTAREAFEIFSSGAMILTRLPPLSDARCSERVHICVVAGWYSK